MHMTIRHDVHSTNVMGAHPHIHTHTRAFSATPPPSEEKKQGGRQEITRGLSARKNAGSQYFLFLTTLRLGAKPRIRTHKRNQYTVDSSLLKHICFQICMVKLYLPPAYVILHREGEINEPSVGER